MLATVRLRINALRAFASDSLDSGGIRYSKGAAMSERTNLTDEEIRTDVAEEIRQETADADMDDTDTDTDDTDSDSDSDDTDA